MQRLSLTSAILLSVARLVGLVDITDALYGRRHLFTAGPPGPCQDAMDTDDDGELTIADPLSSLFFLFGGHRDPSAPGLNCGVDLTQDALRCFANSPCRHSTQTSELAGLVSADGCDDVFDQMRENLTNTMERKLDENLQIPLDILACGAGAAVVFRRRVRQGFPSAHAQLGTFVSICLEVGDFIDAEIIEIKKGVFLASIMKTSICEAFVPAVMMNSVVCGPPSSRKNPHRTPMSFMLI